MDMYLPALPHNKRVALAAVGAWAMEKLREGRQEEEWTVLRRVGPQDVRIGARSEVLKLTLKMRMWNGPDGYKGVIGCKFKRRSHPTDVPGAPGYDLHARDEYGRYVKASQPADNRWAPKLPNIEVNPSAHRSLVPPVESTPAEDRAFREAEALRDAEYVAAAKAVATAEAKAVAESRAAIKCWQDSVFPAVHDRFGCTRADFDGMRQWQQRQLARAAGMMEEPPEEPSDQGGGTLPDIADAPEVAAALEEAIPMMAAAAVGTAMVGTAMVTTTALEMTASLLGAAPPEFAAAFEAAAADAAIPTGIPVAAPAAHNLPAAPPPGEP